MGLTIVYFRYLAWVLGQDSILLFHYFRFIIGKLELSTLCIFVFLVSLVKSRLQYFIFYIIMATFLKCSCDAFLLRSFEIVEFSTYMMILNGWSWFQCVSWICDPVVSNYLQNSSWLIMISYIFLNNEASNIFSYQWEEFFKVYGFRKLGMRLEVEACPSQTGLNVNRWCWLLSV